MLYASTIYIEHLFPLTVSLSSLYGAQDLDVLRDDKKTKKKKQL